ncbi:MAG TPA: ABC transporter permease [Vicinamibacterales bacterium]|nr:ABC transporter permease [Vicinamibacterales bacterium]
MGTLRAWLQRTRLDSDLNREVQFHLEQHVDDLVARGVPVYEARRRAQVELGGADQIKERVRDSRAGAWFDRLRCDARDAWRSLCRSRTTTLTAIALIALVIGGNTTLFSMIHGLLTKPAPAIRATGLVTLEPRVDGRVDSGHSFPDYTDLARQSRTIRSLLACSFASFTIGVADGTYAFRGTKVTANYFDTLGVRLVRGRPFTEAESRLDASGLVAVISYRLWQEQLHGIERVLGQSITVNGHPARIVGVAPERFQGAMLVEFSQIWVPLMAYSRLESNVRALDDRGDSQLFAIGRLAAGVSLRHAQAEISTIAARLAVTYPQTNGRRSVRLVPYSMTAGGNSLVASRGQMFLAVCSIIAALTVLIVCANVANLMLARAAVRQRETALRGALGASRLAIVRSLVFEGLAISMAACVTAYLFAVWMSQAVVRLFPPAAAGGNAMPFDFTPDWRVASYAMCVALLATIVFTLPPAFRVWRQDLLPFLKSGEQGVVAGRLKLSHALTIVQLAFAVLLLTAAGLAFRSVTLISTRDLGFDKDNLLLATISTSGAAEQDEARLNLVERLRDRLRASPMVRPCHMRNVCPRCPGRSGRSHRSVLKAATIRPLPG